MADEQASNDDRTEEASPERREEFREKGQVAVSKEITSVFILAATVGFMSFYLPEFIQALQKMFVTHFQRVANLRISPENAYAFMITIGKEVTFLVVPIFLVTMAVAIVSTLFQTRFNFSWKKLQPDFSRMNPLKGVVRLVSWQAVIELIKGIGKMSAVGLVAYLVLGSEWRMVPSLMHMSIFATWTYWGGITKTLFWGVSTLLVIVAAIDYIYNFVSLEKKLKMTKQEVKDEHKRREVDPHIKNRIRRMQRDMANKRMIESTQDATVVITNPTHYAIALKYEMGMAAPIVIAKGVDYLALRMRETASEFDIPMVENKPLARTLYKMVEIGDDIPDSLFKAVSEIIRYVFKLRGVNYSKATV